VAIRFRPKPTPIVRRTVENAAEKAREVAQTGVGLAGGAAASEAKAEVKKELDEFAGGGPRIAGGLTGGDGASLAPKLGETPAPGGLNAGMLAMGSRAPAKKSRGFDASKSASDLYSATKGGVWGLGTDEDRVFRALDGKSPKEMDAIRASYKEHYRRNLDDDVLGELSGTEKTRADALLKGDQRVGDMDALNHSMKGGLTGLGTDKDKLFATLEKNAGDKDFEADYGKRHGNLREHLKGDLSGADLDRANALLDGDKLGAEAAKLRATTEGVTTDEKGFDAVLKGKTPEQRKAIEQAYEEKYGDTVSTAAKKEHGSALRAHLAKDMSGAELDRAKAHLDGDKIGAKAAEIKATMEGAGTRRQELMDSLRTMPQKDKAAIEARYKKEYGATIDQDLQGDLSSNDLKEARDLHKEGGLSDTQELHYAMKGGVTGVGTDTQRIKDVFNGKSKEEIAGIEKDYKAEYGKDLRTELFGKDGVPLSGELSGRDKFDVEMAMRGKVDTSTDAGVKENLSRARERREFERGGASGFIGRNLVDKLGNDDGKRLDENLGKAEAAYDKAMSDGKMSAAEKAEVNKLSGYAHADVGHYQEAKDSAADAAGTVAATAAATAVTAATMGAGAPLLATTLASAGAGAVAKAGAEGLVKGSSYSNEEMATDAAAGAVEGATAALGAHAGKAIAHKAAERTVSAARQEATTVVSKYAQTEVTKLADDAVRLMKETSEEAAKAGAQTFGGGMKGLGGPIGNLKPMGGPLGTIKPLSAGSLDDLGKGLARGAGALDDAGKAAATLKPPAGFGMGMGDDVAKGGLGSLPKGMPSGMPKTPGGPLGGAFKPPAGMGLGDDVAKGGLGGLPKGPLKPFPGNFKPPAGLGQGGPMGKMGGIGGGATKQSQTLQNMRFVAERMESLGSATKGAKFTPREELVSLATRDLLLRRQGSAAQQAAKKVAWHAAEGGVDGAIGGAASGATEAGLNAETWRNGVRDGLGRMGENAAIAGTIGAVTGAATGAATSKLNKSPTPDDLIDEKLGNAHLRAENLTSVKGAKEQGIDLVLDADPKKIKVNVDGVETDVKIHGARNDADLEFARNRLQSAIDKPGGAARFEQLGDEAVLNHKIGASSHDAITVNRALEPDPPTVKVDVDGTTKEFKIYGSRGPEDVKAAREAIEEWTQRGGAENVHKAFDEVHLRDGLTTDNNVGGLARTGSTADRTILIDRTPMNKGDADRLKYVIWHEGGHKVDGANDMQSGGFTKPWGKGERVSTYAGVNAREDFAETHAHLIRDWDKVMADKGKYLDPNTDIGKKYRSILTNAYGHKFDDVPEIALGQGLGANMGSFSEMLRNQR
jgi:hypothetical protein